MGRRIDKAKEKAKEKARRAAYKVASTPSRYKQRARNVKQSVEIKMASTDPQVFVHDFFTRPLFALAEEATKIKFDKAAEKAEQKLADSFFALEDIVQESLTKRLAEKQASMLLKKYPHLVTGAQSQIKLTYGKPWRGVTPSRYKAKQARASKYDFVGPYERGAEQRGLRSPKRRLHSKRAERMTAAQVKEKLAAQIFSSLEEAKKKMDKD